MICRCSCTPSKSNWKSNILWHQLQRTGEYTALCNAMEMWASFADNGFWLDHSSTCYKQILKTKINPVQLHTLKGKPCTLHISGFKAERFSQLTVKVEKAAVEKPRVVMVKGLHLVQSISTQNRSLLPFTSLSPPTSQTKDFVDPLCNINPLATRQKVISTLFSKLQNQQHLFFSGIKFIFFLSQHQNNWPAVGEKGCFSHYMFSSGIQWVEEEDLYGHTDRTAIFLLL